MKQVTTFEGYYDYYTGWEFDLPVVMVKPVLRCYTPGSAGAGITRAIEDYMIDISLVEDTGQDVHDCRFATSDGLHKQIRKRVLSAFYRARKIGRPRKGATYWKRVIEWDPDDPNVFNELETVS